MNVSQEELHKNRSIDSGWPSEGHIEFRNVTLRYKPSLPAALRDITFSIRGGNQVFYPYIAHFDCQIVLLSLVCRIINTFVR